MARCCAVDSGWCANGWCASRLEDRWWPPLVRRICSAYTLRPRSEPDQSWHQIMFASDYSGHCAHAASRRWSETIVLDLYEDLIALVEVRERSLNPWARHWTPLFCRSFCRIAQRENAGCPAALLLPENCSTQPLSMPFYAGCSPRPRLPAALVIYCSNFCRIPR